MAADIITIVLTGVAVIVWLVRLEAKVSIAASLAEKNEKKLNSIDADIHILQTDSKLVGQSLINMEVELREIKDFLTKGGYDRLRKELLTEIRRVKNG